MNRSLKLALQIAGLVLLLTAFPVVFTTLRGHTAWYLEISNLTITLDNRPTSGWGYRNVTGNTYLFTYQSSEKAKPRTYLLGVSHIGEAFVKDCGSLNAHHPALLVNPTIPWPCSSQEGVPRDPAIGKSFITFVDDEGRKVAARW